MSNTYLVSGHITTRIDYQRDGEPTEEAETVGYEFFHRRSTESARPARTRQPQRSFSN